MRRMGRSPINGRRSREFGLPVVQLEPRKMRCKPTWSAKGVPRGQELVSDGVRDHQPLPPQDRSGEVESGGASWPGGCGGASGREWGTKSGLVKQSGGSNPGRAGGPVARRKKADHLLGDAEALGNVPRWMRSCSSASRPSMSKPAMNSSASRSTRPPSRVCPASRGSSPGAGACVRWCTRSSTAATASRDSGPLRLNRQLASPRARGPTTPTLPDLAGWPCRPNSCLTRAALSCALVIPRAPFRIPRVPALPSHPRAQSGAPREAVAEYVSL